MMVKTPNLAKPYTYNNCYYLYIIHFISHRISILSSNSPRYVYRLCTSSFSVLVPLCHTVFTTS